MERIDKCNINKNKLVKVKEIKVRKIAQKIYLGSA